MRNKKGSKQDKNKQYHELIGLMEQCVEALCARQAEIILDNSDFSAKAPDGAELLKLVQLLEKFIKLKTELSPQEEALPPPDYALLKSYLERKTGHGE